MPGTWPQSGIRLMPAAWACGVEGQLLAHEVGVAAQVAHAGPGLDRGPRDAQVQVVGHGAEKGIDAGQGTDHGAMVGDVELDAVRLSVPSRSIDPCGGGLCSVQRLVGQEDALGLPQRIMS